MSESLAQTQQLYEQIRKAIFDGTQSVDAINDAISALKVKLINFSFANPRKNQSRDELLLIRSVLELSAEWAIHIKDIDHFERDFSQLETFYFDFK
ncbi:26S proteasome non-ATPase regulatory subunit 8 [Spiromyces aspiralis]|uniref:26S proteasome non-ATPase regulatory subunit 8 n=1 Tax=Spiromyces aspiralis TaxID=68401 RepID=A0ACC1HL75_9FUNG|nr:26S proteasome non-ATPase regulatory subunit 8 [Spiromyces aspiralis]